MMLIKPCLPLLVPIISFSFSLHSAQVNRLFRLSTTHYQRGINCVISTILESVSVLFLQSLCLGHIKFVLGTFQHIPLSTSCFDIRLISFHEPSCIGMFLRSGRFCFSDLSHLISIETIPRQNTCRHSGRSQSLIISLAAISGSNVSTWCMAYPGNLPKPAYV